MYKIYIIADQTTTSFNDEATWRVNVEFLEAALETEASYSGWWAIF